MQLSNVVANVTHLCIHPLDFIFGKIEGVGNIGGGVSSNLGCWKQWDTVFVLAVAVQRSTWRCLVKGPSTYRY